MPYSALPAARRRHYEIDGTVEGWNTTSFAAGMTSLATPAQMLTLNEESPTVDAAITSVPSPGDLFFYVLFPERVDLSFFVVRFANVQIGNLTLSNLTSSSDTTNGADGTWTAMASTGTRLYDITTGAGDWWRANAPATLTSNNTNITAIRFQVHNGDTLTNSGFRNLYIWGTKHSGQTPEDIIILQSDATTEWPNDDDWGDVGAGTAAVTHTYYVKNTSATLTANAITVKASGSDSARWTVSLDNASFASSKSIASLAPGATQVVYFKFTPPALTAGTSRPYAAYLEADVTNWAP